MNKVWQCFFVVVYFVCFFSFSFFFFFFFRFRFFLSKPVTLCFSDLFKETDTFDKVMMKLL